MFEDWHTNPKPFFADLIQRGHAALIKNPTNDLADKLDSAFRYQIRRITVSTAVVYLCATR